MQHLRHCLNPRVITGLAVVAAGVWVFAPGAFAAALPLLILAICPLSMIGMMLLMRGGGQGAASGASRHTADSPRQAQTSSADGDSPAAALRARVAELEARLAAEARPKEAPAGQAVARDAD